MNMPIPDAADIIMGVLPYLMLAALLGSIVRIFTDRSAPRVAAAVLAAAVFIPVSGLTIAGYLRVLTDALSVVSIALLLSAAVGPLRGARLLDRRDGPYLVLAGAALAIALYPSAFGFLSFDVYRWGYGSFYLPTLIGTAVLWAWMTARYRATLVLLVAVIAFHLRLLLSPNLWDYVTDPYLPMAALIYLVVCGCRAAFRRVAAGTGS